MSQALPEDSTRISGAEILGEPLPQLVVAMGLQFTAYN